MTTERRRRRRTREPAPAAAPNTDFSAVVGRIKSVTEMSQYHKSLFYGRSGTGKTTLACTYPGPVLLLDIREEGTDSVVDQGDRVKVLEVETWDDIEQVYWYLKSGDHPFKTVVIDTVTQMMEFAKIEALEREGKTPDSLIAKNTWGTISGLMNTWMINFRDLDMHVVFLAQDRVTAPDDDADEDQIVPEVGPRLTPSAAATLNASVKIIGHTYIKEVTRRTPKGLEDSVEYRLRVGPHGYYTTKVRNPRKSFTPPYLTDPTFELLDQVFRGDYKPPKKKKKKEEN